MSRASSPRAACPSCDAEIRPGSETCWLCQAPLPARGDAWPAGDIQDSGVAAASTGLRPLQFSLASLMLLTTLIAVVLGLSVEIPELGIPLGLLSSVAYVRSVSASRRRLERGEAISIGGRIGQFLWSLFIVWAVCVGSGIAFFVACAATCSISGATESAGLLMGGLFGGASLIALMILIWPKRRRAASADTGSSSATADLPRSDSPVDDSLPPPGAPS